MLVVVRAVTGRGEPLPRPRPVHFVLALATLSAVCSALISHTLFQRAPMLKIVEAFGAFPFLIFYLAPVIYTTRRKRQMLLTALVILGAYLGLTVLFEMAHVERARLAEVHPQPPLRAALWPGQGPFADAVANGMGLYVCGLAACVSAVRWRGRTRAAAVVVIGLCAVGLLLTLERSVWTGTAAGSLVALLAFARLRRYAFPAILTAAVAVGLALVLIPGLSAKVSARASDQESVWDRQNLTVAALKMIAARPLTGSAGRGSRRRAHPTFSRARTSRSPPRTSTSTTTSSPMPRNWVSSACCSG